MIGKQPFYGSLLEAVKSNLFTLEGDFFSYLNLTIKKTLILCGIMDLIFRMFIPLSFKNTTKILDLKGRIYLNYCFGSNFLTSPCVTEMKVVFQRLLVKLECH